MQPHRLILVLMLATISRCAGSARRVEFGCPYQPAGETSAEIRAGAGAPEARPGAAAAALVVRVVAGTPDARPLGAASVTLHADTAAWDVTAAVRAGSTLDSGVVRLDSVPAGRYGVLVRRIGYAALRHVVSVRPTVADTLVARLRYEPACLVQRERQPNEALQLTRPRMLSTPAA